jgi:hypothetical protein
MTNDIHVLDSVSGKLGQSKANQKRMGLGLLLGIGGHASSEGAKAVIRVLGYYLS